MSRNIEKWRVDREVIEDEYVGYTWPGKILSEPYRRDRVYLKKNGCLLEFKEHDFNPDKYILTVADGEDCYFMCIRKKWITPREEFERTCKFKLEKKKSGYWYWWLIGKWIFATWALMRKHGIDISEEECKKILRELKKRREFYADLSTTRNPRCYRRKQTHRVGYSQRAKAIT